MQKQELIDELIENHNKFILYFSKLDDEDFIFSLNNEKWTAGQQADHIVRSLVPLKLIFGLPKWLSKLGFKKANRASKSYEQLFEKYNQRLQRGGTASGRFVPDKIKCESKAALARKVQKTVFKLCRSLTKYSEEDLDMLVLPHPLLGYVTLREMLYFTIFHVEHHHNIAIRNLAGK